MLQRTHLERNRHVSMNPLRATVGGHSNAGAIGHIGLSLNGPSSSAAGTQNSENDGLDRASEQGLTASPITHSAAAQTESSGEVGQAARVDASTQRHQLQSSSNLDDSATLGPPATVSTQGSATTASSSSSSQPQQGPPSTTTVYTAPAPFPDLVNFDINPVVSSNSFENPGSSIVNDVSLEGPVTSSTLYSIPGNVSTQLPVRK